MAEDQKDEEAVQRKRGLDGKQWEGEFGDEEIGSREVTGTQGTNDEK